MWIYDHFGKLINANLARKLTMRVVEEISHPGCKITIFSWNQKYILKLERGQYEQTYKLKESDVMGLDDVKGMLNDTFLESCAKRFVEMSQDFSSSFKNKNTVN